MLLSSLFKEQRRKPKGESMSYLVLKGTVIGGKQVRAGDVVEVEGVEARELIGMGRIVEVVKTETKVEDRSVGLTEETKPKRRTRKKAE
jgi:hypothetical protein